MTGVDAKAKRVGALTGGGGNFVLESVRIDRNLKGIRCVG